MKIAIFPGVFFPLNGGAQVQAHNLANKFVEKGHLVDMYLLNNTNIKKNKYKIIKLNKIFLHIFFLFKYYLKIDLTYFFNLYFTRFYNLDRYDVFHFHLLNYKILLIINALKKYNKNLKIVATFHGIDLQINKKIKYGYRLSEKYNVFLKNTLKNIDFFQSISQTIYDDLIKIGIKKTKICKIPNSICLSKFKKRKKNKFLIKKKYPIKLITVTRFAKNKKGLDLITTIGKKLINQKVNFVWTLVGDNLIKISEEKDFESIKNNFKFIPNILLQNESYFPNSRLIEEYNKANLYVNLARIESFGLTVLEALASKLAVISFNTKGSNELVKNNYNGFLIKNNTNEMVKKIHSLSLGKYQNNFKNKNFNNSVKRFDLNYVSVEMIKLYKKIKFNIS